MNNMYENNFYEVQNENGENNNHKKNRRSNRFARGIAYTLVFGLVAGGTFGGVNYVYNHNGNGKAAVATQTQSTTEPLKGNTGNAILNTSSVTTSSINDVSGLAKEVMPSIVSITCTSQATSNGIFGGQQGSSSQVSAGTGIIVSQDNTNLYIATNNHVVDGAAQVKVTFSDEKQVDATVKGTAASSDLAVVQVKLADIKDETKSAIRIATLGNSDNAKVGEMVVAIGNALGYGQSVTVGYLSAKGREVQTDDYTMKLLQTDAAINPGNSGGALLNASGQVVGINSAKYTSQDVEGIGYAIPISYAIPIINELISQQTVAKEDQGYLGIRFYEVTNAYAKQFNIPEGIFVSSVVDKSPASKAGVQSGDIIVAIDGRAVTKSADFQEILQTKAANTEIKLTIQRQSNSSYKEKEIKVTLGKKSDYEDRSSQGSDNSGNNQGGNSSQEQNPYYYFFRNNQ